MMNLLPSKKDFPVLVILCAILAFAAYLRFSVVTGSWVLAPYRADAAEYYNYAYNLRQHDVYARGQGFNGNRSSRLKPDAFRTPGYPLFLSLFATQPPNAATFRTIELWQALLGTLVVLMVFLIFRIAASPWSAVCASFLTAISPHLVNATIYILSETLFTLLITLILLALALHLKNRKRFVLGLLATGILIGMASLTRPVLEYFLPCLILLLFLSYTRSRALKGSAILFLGFLLIWAPWMARNYVVIGAGENNQLMMGTLHQGMYPGLMYNNDPRTLAYPYDFDPNYKKDNKNLTTVIQTVLRQFKKHPVQEVSWYLLGKPVMLWSWDMIAGAGDVFIYPTLKTPYSSNQAFRITHALMYGWHWPLVVAAFLMCILAWLPMTKRYFDDKQLFLLRAMSLLLFYNTGILVIGAPYPRYSIPFLPILYGMAMAFIFVAYHYLGEVRRQSRDSYAKKYPD